MSSFGYVPRTRESVLPRGVKARPTHTCHRRPPGELALALPTASPGLPTTTAGLRLGQLNKQPPTLLILVRDDACMLLGGLRAKQTASARGSRHESCPL